VPNPVTYLLLSDRANNAALITPDCVRAGKAVAAVKLRAEQTNMAVRRSHIWVLILLRNGIRCLQINRLSGLVPSLAQCRLLGLADSQTRFQGWPLHPPVFAKDSPASISGAKNQRVGPDSQDHPSRETYRACDASMV
jgi:hypothetical protein